MVRRLKADEIECRVAQISANGCSLLLYKTARVDRAILEELYGNRWQNDFKVIDSKMYGGIGIYDSELKEWLWRWECGTESNTEQEKGQASDCFKRAGFKWGIGVELYSAPFIWYNCPTKKNDKGKWELEDKYTKFQVSEIGYSDNGNINHLIIIDNNNKQVFKLGSKPKPKKNNDIDIIEGLKAQDTSKNAENYYQQYKDKVIDLEKFKEEYTTVWKSLRKKEKENETA
jgi:hypothetical protein